MQIDKSLATSLSAAAITLLSFLLPPSLQPLALSTGLFALSGALTNWLAVHMLFERVPGFYGSGVIPLHFKEFKRGIRKLIMQQFFSRENIQSFMMQSGGGMAETLERTLPGFVDEVDLDGAFDSLLDVIMASSFASMLGLLGGRDALKTLREPFVARMRDYLRTTVSSEDFRNKLADRISHSGSAEELQGKIERIVDRRLEELTPALVRMIIEDMIRRHLGWLVVWGGVLGGLMGLAVALLSRWLA